jgi:uncharacterized membrane protein (DUF4010 family)
MHEFLNNNSPLFFDFAIITLLSLIIGLEQRRHHQQQEEKNEELFGTDRTFTFIGIFGFILFTIDPVGKILFIMGGCILTIFLAIYYYSKIQQTKKFGLTSILSALITYCLSPLVITQPTWFALLIVVTVLIFTEMKEEFLLISKKFGKDEFIILAKFILIAGIILPNLPDKQVFAFMKLTPYDLWLAIVVVSGISYFSYLLQKFVFRRSGVILSAILGGLYSSTAVSLILSRKSHDKLTTPNEYAAAIIFATTVMYIRVFLIVFIFNPTLATMLLPYQIAVFISSLLTGLIILRMKEKKNVSETPVIGIQGNPLEFKVALGFTVFYIAFSFLLTFAESHYGESGLNLLSFLAGFADVDSYTMNLVQGRFAVTELFMVASILIATTSNNLIKGCYSFVLAEKKTKKIVAIGFSAILLVNIVVIVIVKLVT